MGTVAVRGIHLNLKPPPLGEFEASFKMFTSAAETSNRAAKALVCFLIFFPIPLFSYWSSQFSASCCRRPIKLTDTIMSKESPHLLKALMLMKWHTSVGVPPSSNKRNLHLFLRHRRPMGNSPLNMVSRRLPLSPRSKPRRRRSGRE